MSGLIDELDMDLRKNPMDLRYSQNLWDGKLLSHHLREKYEIDPHTRQCQRIFRKLRFRLRKPRPAIAKGDDHRKEAFEKNMSAKPTYKHARPINFRSSTDNDNLMRKRDNDDTSTQKGFEISWVRL